MGVDTAPTRHHLTKTHPILQAADDGAGQLAADIEAALEADRFNLPITAAILAAIAAAAGADDPTRWATHQAAAAAAQINVTNQRAIRDATEAGIRDNIDLAIVVRNLENLIGLTPGHAAAVDRLYRSSILAGVTEEHALRIAAAKRQRLLRWRAEMIARTESVRAANMGQQLAWLDAIDTGQLPRGAQKVWVAVGDSVTCPICAVLDGQVVGVAGSFSVNEQATRFTRRGATFTVQETRPLPDPTTTRTPPAHPQCRCVLVLV